MFLKEADKYGTLVLSQGQGLRVWNCQTAIVGDKLSFYQQKMLFTTEPRSCVILGKMLAVRYHRETHSFSSRNVFEGSGQIWNFGIVLGQKLTARSWKRTRWRMSTSCCGWIHTQRQWSGLLFSLRNDGWPRRKKPWIRREACSNNNRRHERCNWKLCCGENYYRRWKFVKLSSVFAVLFLWLAGNCILKHEYFNTVKLY